MYKKDQVVVTPHGKAKITVVDEVNETVRVEHLEARTPITDYKFSDLKNNTVDLSKCKKGDILISTHGAKLEYISKTPWKHYTYLDHVVRYIEDKDGKSFGDNNYGTRTNDGFVFANNRKPETDHDIANVI